MKKPKKRMVALLTVATAGIVVAATVLMTRGNASSGVPVQVTPLVRTDLTGLVSASGTMESVDSRQVYSELNSSVETVHVEVGDRVSAGDPLCELDTSKLKLQIAKQQAALNSTAAAASNSNEAAQHNVEVNQKKLENEQEDLKKGLNASVVSAENMMKTAERLLKDAKKALEDAEEDFARARHLVGEDDITWEDSVSYSTSDGNFVVDGNLVAYKDREEAARKTYTQAKLEYDNAAANLEAARNSADRQLESLKDDIKSSEIAAGTPTDLQSQQIQLQELQMDLADSVITAPIDGTVTAVYATEGAPANGLMFVVEDTDNLVVKTSLREFDLAEVKVGQKVEVKSDATGNQIFEGKVRKISPTAKKSSSGSTDSASGAEFETEIELDSGEGALRIGMNARLSIITAQKQNVLAVPFDALVTDEQGRDIVYTAVPSGDEKGGYIAKAVPVTAGMETDFDVEIHSDELKDGAWIITDPSMISDGAAVTLPAAVTAQPESSAAEDASIGASGSSQASGTEIPGAIEGE